jgi:hypothetical protein
MKKELKKLKFNLKFKNNIYKEKLKIGLNSLNINKYYFKNIYNLKNMLKTYLNIKKKYIFIKRNYITNIYINSYKFNYVNIINLKNIIYNIYHKEIFIKIINIKYLYLDNSIFIDSITRKLNDRKKSVLRVLKKALKLIKIAQLNPNELKKRSKEMHSNKYMNNINYLYNIKNTYINIYNNIKNIHIIGITLEAKGRLTRRMTASRSVYKLRHKGNLKNMYMYYYKTPSFLLRGYIKSNIDQVKNNSKNKNGSFGLTSKQNTF